MTSPADPQRAPEPRLAFRPDVEGLRGVAILLVVAYHAAVPGVSGGFIGVDVFFVLSGYLITALLLAELATSGRVSLSGFYARRIRRLLPAGATVLAATMLTAALVHPPLEVTPVANAARAAAVFVSNLHFAGRATDYFRDSVDTSPLLHTWSLSVEEQFYLVWPWLVLLAAPARSRESRLAGALIALAVTSLAASWWFTAADRRTAYYGMPMRAWEFALGALVALPPVTAYLARRAGRSRELVIAAGWMGLAAVIAPAFWFSARTPFPGVHAVIPVAGTAIVLAAGIAGSSRGSATSAISASWLQWVGRHSYSWYLWHWPVLVFAAGAVPAIAGSTGVLSRIGLMLVALGASVVTRMLIEDPCRHSRVLRQRQGVTVLAGVAAVALLYVAASALGSGAAEASRSPRQQAFAAARRDIPRLYEAGCSPEQRDASVHSCGYGVPDARTTVVLFGDSHAAQWFPALESIALERRWTLVVLTKASCPSVDLPVFHEHLQRTFTECDDWRRAAFDTIVARRPSLVVISNSTEYVLGGPRHNERASVGADAWEGGLARTLTSLHDAGLRVVVIQDTPTAREHVPACLARAAWRGQDGARCDFLLSQGVHQGVARATRRTVSRFGNTQLIDLAPALCTDDRCPAAPDGTIRYRDARHLTATASAQLAPAVERGLSQAGVLEPTADGRRVAQASPRE